MGRPSLPIGSHGEIYTIGLATGAWMARAQFRSADGVTRTVKRHGSTKAKAIIELRKALVQKTTEANGNEIMASTKFRIVAELWFAEQARLAAQGTKAMTTVDQYRDHYRRHVERAMGDLTIRECTVSRCHRYLTEVWAKSPATGKQCRNILSGVLGWAVIHKALEANPVRDVGRMEAAAKKPARALEARQILDWLALIEKDEAAVRWDLPDVTRWLLATGVRIGEAIAVSWDEIDWDLGAVDIAWHLVRTKGQGLVRQPSTKAHTERRLQLPSWGIEMLTRRKEAAGGYGDSPIFPSSLGLWRDPKSVGKAIRAARRDTDWEWLTSHSLGRKTVATILDEGGATARQIADQLGHSRVSMTQDVYMKRRSANGAQAAILGTALTL